MLCNNLFDLTYKANFLPIKLLQTLLGNSKGPVEQGNRNTCAEVKLCLFLFLSVQEIVCRETEAFYATNFG